MLALVLFSLIIHLTATVDGKHSIQFKLLENLPKYKFENSKISILNDQSTRKGGNAKSFEWRQMKRILEPNGVKHRAARKRRHDGYANDEAGIGNKPLGSMKRFSRPADPSFRWVGYFFEESLMAVLQSDKNTMVDCVVVEIRKDKEQRRAYVEFGKMMQLVPLELKESILLIRLCGELPVNQIHPDPAESVSRFFQSRQTFGDSDSQRFSMLIVPGTLWCGIRDKAERYEHIGDKEELDKCCRAHDYCPIKISAFESRYGVDNLDFRTRSHCLCEEEFLRCLKSTEQQVSNMIGLFYFNFSQVRCLGKPQANATSSESYRRGQNRQLKSHPPYKCMLVDQQNKCRLWEKTNEKRILQFNKLNSHYQR